MAAAAGEGTGLRLAGDRLASSEPVGKAGVFDQLHLDILDRLGEQGRLDWSRASVDSASVRASSGDHVGASPVDRGKPGSTIQLVCAGHGLPLTAAVTANMPDVTMLAAMVDDSAANRARLRRRGSPRGSPDAASSRRPGWGGIAGGWSGRCRGCRATGAWRFAGTGLGAVLAFLLLACLLVCFNQL